MHYLLNIGNTRVALLEASALKGALPRIRHFGTGEFLGKWRPSGSWRATVACVVPEIRRKMPPEWLVRSHFIDTSDYPGMDFSAYGRGLGADRIANAAAAHALVPGRAVLVVDCGTALNTVAVTADGKFHGGVILPGRQTALNSLGRQTAQLPEITAEITGNTFNPLALNTKEAIQNGVGLALLAAVERVIRDTRRQPGFARCQVWLTGGDAPFYASHLPLRLKAALAPVPLTLYGIALANPNLAIWQKPHQPAMATVNSVGHGPRQEIQ